MCSVSEGLCALMSSDVCLFYRFFKELIAKAMQPVTLHILVMSQDYLDKTVASPGVGAYVKGDDSLLQWIKETARLQDVEPRLFTKMILNWEDGNNLVFESGTNSDEA